MIIHISQERKQAQGSYKASQLQSWSDGDVTQVQIFLFQSLSLF